MVMRALATRTCERSKLIFSTAFSMPLTHVLTTLSFGFWRFLPLEAMRPMEYFLHCFSPCIDDMVRFHGSPFANLY